MPNRWRNRVLIISVAMNTAFVAVAGYGYLHMRSQHASSTPFHLQKDQHFYEVLALSQSQLEAITPMAMSFHEQLDRLHAEMEVKKQTMLGLLRGEESSAEGVEHLRRQMATTQADIQKKVIAHILDVKTILDDAQQQRFFELLRKSMTQTHPMIIPAGAE